MRILHTSDWHLGQYFMGRSRQTEHAALVDWLVQQVQAHQVDAVILAGDVFDTSNPPSHARQLYYTLVLRLHEAGCQLIVLAGNHDSVATLGESRELLACLNTQVIPAASPHQLHSQLLTLRNRQQRPAALLCAVPYIRAQDVVTSHEGDSADDRRGRLQQAIASHYQQLYALARQRAQDMQPPDGPRLPILATGHLTLLGARSSESVRDIYIGTLDAVPASILPPFDYVALGHIHRPQRVAGCAHIRYCGAPLALGFDEAGEPRQMLLVDLAPAPSTTTPTTTSTTTPATTPSTTPAAAQTATPAAPPPAPPGVQVTVTPLPVPVFQPMASITGTLDDLATQLPQAVAAALHQQQQVQIQGQPHTPPLPVWLAVQVQDDAGLPDLQERVTALLQQLPAHLPAQLLLLRRQRLTAPTPAQPGPPQTVQELTPAAMFERRLACEPALDEQVRQQLHDRHQQVLQQVLQDLPQPPQLPHP